MKHHTTRAAALLAALAMCAASAFAAMPDEEFVELCRGGTAEQVKQALAEGANPNAREDGGDTALMWAALGDKLPVVQALLAAGADVNARNRGVTALTFWTNFDGEPRQVSPEHAKVVRALLKAGADPTGGCRGDDEGVCRTPLVWEALGSGDAATIRVFLEDGGDVRAQGGDEALMNAARYNRNPGVSEALLSAGAGAALKNDALRQAASHQNLQAVRELLAASADASAKDAEGHDALWHAKNPNQNFDPELPNPKETRAAIVRLLEQGGGAKKPAAQGAAAPCPPGWQGEYEWFESEEHPSGEMRMVWDYQIRIAEEQGRCQAWLTGDGHSMMMRILADVQGDARAVRLLYREALPDAGPGSGGERGAELLRLERRERELLTHWGTMTPNAEDAKPGVRFKQKQPAEKKGGGSRAALRVYVSDPTGTATNVRAAPGGSVVGTLAAGGDYLVTLAGCEKGWCRATAIDTVDAGPVAHKKGGERWLHTSVLAFSTRNYGYQKLALRAKPDEASAPAFSFTDERALRPLDVRAGWVLAETLDKKHRGWLQTEWVCGNPVTTCP